MAQNYKFEGWVAHGADAADGKMKYEEFKPKTWTEDDVDIQISHSGICGVCIDADVIIGASPN